MKHVHLFTYWSGILLSIVLAVGCGNSTPATSGNSPQPGATAPSSPTLPTTTPSLNLAISIPQGAMGRGTGAYGANPAIVQQGTIVTWTNNDSAPHTVTADDNSFNSGTMATGQTFQRSFMAPGMYPYHCTIHGKASMSGMVQVMGPSATPNP